MILKGTTWYNVKSPAVDPEVFKNHVDAYLQKILFALEDESKVQKDPNFKKRSTYTSEQVISFLIEFLRDSNAVVLSKGQVLQAMKKGLKDEKKK